ncbi:MAG: efflux RND transporter permease subunit [Flavobacteriaceae bacterium]|jgi:HAE1 family hydrophobic/amphiphilic exporter-1|nr:efflux RND transporter permease subunit [Flavobacteriaceae bacterium]
MIKTFIERPALSTVISIFIVVLGIIGITTLPVEQYPRIAPPTVQVSANYRGANADVVMSSVVVPLEERINGVEGMTYMTSSATNDGDANISIYFEQEINPDIAAVNVQNLVARATSRLPEEVVQNGITVRKQQSGTILMITLYTDRPDYDGKFLQNYANINILPQIQRIKGVGDAGVRGAQDYSMRIWFNPQAMAAYQITPTEVISALQDQNIEAAPGELGQNGRQTFQYILRFTGKLRTEKEFENIIIRSENGTILRVKDIAKVELGALNYTVISRVDGKQAISISVSQTSDANAQEVINQVKKEMEQASQYFPPGLNYIYMMDANEFLSASITKVIHTLIEAFILVFLVVFVFLQDFRSTIIPAVAVPVAIVGTFFFLKLFGFSINLLTLFALILAIGIVVDDAIVVVEAVHARLDKGEKNPKIATLAAMKEITPAIISITLVMSAVFIPVSFIGGTSGIFYKQFGLTLATAIIISAVNALTLSPALCALFLRPHEEKLNKKKNLPEHFYDGFNRIFNSSTEKYKNSLIFLGKKNHRWIILVIIILSICTLAFLMKTIPSGFVPQEDSGGVMGNITLPPGSSLERSDSITDMTVEIASKLPSLKGISKTTGTSRLSGESSSYGSLMIKLQPWEQRSITINDVVDYLKKSTDTIKAAKFMFFGNPTLQGFGVSNGVELQLQDRTGGDILKFYEVTNNFIDKMKERNEVSSAMTIFDPNFPQKLIEADIAKIKDAGLTLSQVMTTLQAYIGSMYISDFNLFGKQYRVMAQASPDQRASLNELNGMYIKTAGGEMAPITRFITVKDVTGAQRLSRFNMYSSMSVNINPNFTGGYSSGEVINAVEEVAKETLPQGYSYDFSGLTREEVNSGNQLPIIFMLCLVFIYLLLVALYESYILPFIIIFSLPVGLSGIYIFIKLFGVFQGITNNIYVQVTLIMLIGLLAKNAILIVEYAVQRRRQGMSIVDAAINGAVARLRPILMTSFAFIFGLLPLALASGAGAVGNRSIGISAIGGMLIGTLLGLVIIPTLYIVFQSLQEKITRSEIFNRTD